jgi:hypothetical protein
MSEPPIEYQAVRAPVTIVVDAEWADFLTRVQEARNEWRRHRCVSHVALVDWRNLSLRTVSLDDQQRGT